MAELYIYDVIGADFFGEGVTAKSVRDELKKIPDDEDLVVRVNSPGGDVFEAAAIVSLLSERKYDTKIDGAALSAASYIPMFSNRISMSSEAMMMIHDPWTLTIGDAVVHGKAVDLLEEIGLNIARAYVDRSGKSMKAVREAMRAETWFTAEEAKAFGLVDEVVKMKAAAYKIPGTFGYRNMPKEETTAPTVVLPDRPPRVAVEAMRRRLALARAEFRKVVEHE